MIQTSVEFNIDTAKSWLQGESCRAANPGCSHGCWRAIPQIILFLSQERNEPQDFLMGAPSLSSWECSIIRDPVGQAAMKVDYL